MAQEYTERNMRAAEKFLPLAINIVEQELKLSVPPPVIHPFYPAWRGSPSIGEFMPSEEHTNGIMRIDCERKHSISALRSIVLHELSHAAMMHHAKSYEYLKRKRAKRFSIIEEGVAVHVEIDCGMAVAVLLSDTRQALRSVIAGYAMRMSVKGWSDYTFGYKHVQNLRSTGTTLREIILDPRTYF